MSRTNGTDPRRHYTPDEKAMMLRRHLADQVAVSDLCDEYQLKPSVFYLWQRQALERLSEGLQDGRSTRAQRDAGAADRARVAALEARLARKDAMIVDIAAEHLALKRKLGER